MNILTDALPGALEIDGKLYKINTDFRAGIEFEMLIQDGCHDTRLLFPFFPDGLPSDVSLEKIVEAIELFYCCGALPEKKSTPKSKKQGYSFAVDASTIFADFWNFYNIDLSQEGLHWWAFRSLLEGLPEKSEFKQRIYYRTCDTKGMTKKEKERIAKIRASIEIKSKDSGTLTLEERNAKMKAYVQKRSKEVQEVKENG